MSQIHDKIILMALAHCQGGHSDAGAIGAEYLGIPFPITMENLALAATVRSFDPDELWPWWAKMRAEQELANIALALTPAQRRALKISRIDRGRGYWPLYNALRAKGLVSNEPGHPLTEKGEAVRAIMERMVLA